MRKHPKTILFILAVFVLFLMTPGLAYADEGVGGAEIIVHGYHIRLIFSGAVKTGENPLHIQLTGADGTPLKGANVQVAAQPVTHAHAGPTPEAMDGMAGMSGMAAATPTPQAMAGMNMKNDDDAQTLTVTLQAGHDAGDYAGTILFPQAGHWTLLVHVMLASGEMFSAEFPLAVAAGAPASYGILAGFIGLNVVIILTAALAKRKTVRA